MGLSPEEIGEMLRLQDANGPSQAQIAHEGLGQAARLEQMLLGQVQRLDQLEEKVRRLETVNPSAMSRDVLGPAKPKELPKPSKDAVGSSTWAKGLAQRGQSIGTR